MRIPCAGGLTGRQDGWNGKSNGVDMGKEYGVNILIQAIDRATAPIRAVAAQAKGLVAPMKDVGARVKKLGETTGITRLAKSIKELPAPLKKSWEEAGKLVAKLGLLGGGMLGGAIAAFKRLFLDTATGNEDLARSMQNVVGSADKSRAALAYVQQSMKGLPVDVNDATKAYMRLKQEGIDPQGGALKLVRDAAGHTGKSLSDVADILAGMKNGQTAGLADLLGGNVKQVGNYMVAEFADATGKVRRMAVKQGANLAENAKAMQNLFRIATKAKGMEGGAERFGESWQGMLLRVRSTWQRFSALVMDSGPFKLLKEKFQGILGGLAELEASGGLQALAEEWAKTFCDAITAMWDAGKAIAAWVRSDFLPAFNAIKDFMGGWGGIVKAVAAYMAGSFLVSLYGSAKAAWSFGAALYGPLSKGLLFASKGVLSLGTALMTTPIGWIIAGIAAVAASAYLIWKHWSTISAFFKELWGTVTGIFSTAWDSIKSSFQGFAPLDWIADAMNSLTQYLFGFDLSEAGTKIVAGITGGMKGAWDGLVGWFKGAWDKLTGWLPDIIKTKLGISASGPDSGGGSSAGASTTAAVPALAGSGATGAESVLALGRATGAGAVMASGAAAAPGRTKTETKVVTEVLIKGENLPAGMAVSTPKSGADKTRIDCGYMLPGAG